MKDIKAILKDLADAEPYKPAKKLFMDRAGKLSGLMLVLSMLCMVLLGVSGLCYKVDRSPVLAYVALTFWLLTTLFGILTMLVEPIAMFVVMLRWKAETLDTFVREIENDEAHVRRLIHHDEEALRRVQYWLQLKAKRLDARIVFFFGGSAAVYSLLALTLSNMKDAGGLSWLENTFLRGFAADNLANTAILWGIALVFGASVGAMLMKVVQGRYTYHLELVELALMRKSSDATTPASPAGV
ncbi:hypothetical protein [Paraburkholderia aspalathi]|uniref:Uncharacterized protein n=1 Tax=Paraburkholderia aspalathi TaxID=1324617 RepID=A0A1I7B9Y6_9BURK|nr:hypothetical protein [Paraburkholderia aspalathi]SFT84010.1 hypothetical protein SAMN05192563_1004308 [Paraburkholderia aspalathi]